MPAVDEPSLARRVAVNIALSPSVIVSSAGARATLTVGAGADPPSPAQAAKGSSSAARVANGVVGRRRVRAAAGAE
jgi:hypothetical protein